MAITKAAASLLFELKTTQTIGGTICQLGRQTILVSTDKIRKVAKSFGVDSKATSEELPWTGNADDVYLFETLGYDKVESIDADNFENASYVMDFNLEVPDEFHNRFDAIYDGGTMEHIFNLPQVLKNIHKMLKPGGMIMHLSPSHNHVDHGFYMFSPTFFYDYYKANNYEIVRTNILEYSPNPMNPTWKIYNYESLSLEHLAYGGWDNSMLGIWFVAKKTILSSDDAIPQQARYVKVWDTFKSKPSINLFDEKSVLGKLARKLQGAAKGNRTAYSFFYFTRNLYFGFKFLFKSNKKPTVIARY